MKYRSRKPDRYTRDEWNSIVTEANYLSKTPEQRARDESDGKKFLWGIFTLIVVCMMIKGTEAAKYFAGVLYLLAILCAIVRTVRDKRKQ